MAEQEHEVDDITGGSDGSWHFAQEEVEQVVARKHEKAKTLEGLPILRQVLEQFDTDIAFYSSVKAIPKELGLDPEQFMIMHHVHEGMCERLEVKRAYIQSLIDTYAPNR